MDRTHIFNEIVGVEVVKKTETYLFKKIIAFYLSAGYSIGVFVARFLGKLMLEKEQIKWMDNVVPRRLLISEDSGISLNPATAKLYLWN